MTNYNKFYNAWQAFAKPKRQLLLEEVKIPIKMAIRDFLVLTTTPSDLQNIKYNISRGGFKNEGEGSLTVKVDEHGNAIVVSHEGRHRATTLKLKFIKEKSIQLMEKLPKAIKDTAPDLGEKEIQQELDHILLLGYPDKVQVNITQQLRTLISNADKESDNHLIDTLIIVENKDEGFDYKNINKFIGQFDKTATVQRTLTSTRQVTADMSDPLKIGNGVDIVGYDLDTPTRIHAAGIQNFFHKKYGETYALQKDGYRGYVQLLNNAYTVSDSEGNQYQIVFGKGSPDWFSLKDPRVPGKKWYPSMNNIHLEPHPYILYGDSIEAKDKANSLTYTIKKK